MPRRRKVVPPINKAMVFSTAPDTGVLAVLVTVVRVAGLGVADTDAEYVAVSLYSRSSYRPFT